MLTAAHVVTLIVMSYAEIVMPKLYVKLSYVPLDVLFAYVKLQKLVTIEMIIWKIKYGPLTWVEK